MRILMLAWEFPPSSMGGMAAQIDGLAHSLTTMGHDVVVITRKVAGSAEDASMAGVRVIRVDTDLPWIDIDAIAAAASANHHFVAAIASLGDWRPDVVHTHDWNTAWAASTIARLVHAPLVTTFHGTARSRHGGHLPLGIATEISVIEWWLAIQSSQIITITKLIGRDVIDAFEVDPGVVHHVPSGIDPTWWRTLDPGETRDRGQTVLAWGRVQYEKGFQVLARAIGSLRDRGEPVHCVIGGRGSYLPELQSQIDVAQAGELIELPGYLADSPLRNAIHKAGCVVIPSLYEPFGVVALEALAAEAPLIVADTGGLAEVVAGTGAALLFEPGNADALADCIELVLNNPDVAADLVRHGRELIERRYSSEAIATQTVTVYEYALGTDPITSR